MIAARAVRCLGLAIWMLVCFAGCGGSPDLIQPTDEELAQEIFPMDLPSAKPTPTPPPPAPAFHTHIVRGTGETYMAIARWYTGDAENWRSIAQANPAVEPRRMRIGTVIRIPEALVVNRRPMPKPAPVPRPAPPAPTPTPKPVPRQTPPPTATPVAVELYGPIGAPATPSQPAPAAPVPELEPLER